MNKKGFGEVVSTLILFIAVITISTSLVVAFNQYVSKTQSSLKVQNDIISNKLKTSVSITNIVYNSTTTTLYIYAKNIGETKLLTSKFDMYVDNVFTQNFSVVYPDNLSKSKGLLLPLETALFVKVINLTPGTHEVELVSEYGTRSYDYFNT